MILTGKAKEDFLEWYGELETYFYRLNTTCQFALIIEWLDSVGVYVFIERAMYLEFPNFIYRIETKDDLHEGYRESNRKEATKHAIIKANEIHNERK